MEHAMVVELIGKGIFMVIGSGESLFGTGALFTRTTSN